MLSKNNIGLFGEREVERLLRKLFPDMNICWTRREKRNNEPFDFEVYGKEKAVLLVEVRTFSDKRKWEWTQFKRPQIRRKKERAKKLGNPLMITMVVKLGTEIEIRWAKGFPSQPFERFDGNPYNLAKLSLFCEA